MYTAADCRLAMVDAALTLHESVIKDLSEPDPTPRKIERLLDTACAGWELGEDGRYTSESEAEWCGYTIAAAGRMLGDYLESRRCLDVALARPVAVHCLPSCSRMHAASRWSDAQAPQPEHPDPSEIQRGDIVAVRTTGSQPHGDHLVLATDAPNSVGFDTVEGNAYGRLGDGQHGQGVIRGRRVLEKVYQVYRLGIDHFEGTDL